MQHKQAIRRAVLTWFGGDKSHVADWHDEDMEKCIRSYLEAMDLVAVPKTPTRKMQAAFEADYVEWFDDKIEDPDHLYKVMIAAAPDPFGEASHER